ncbi:MAG: exosortase H-associated membrane protein [Ottowia sp.]|nr:hypothetical protein [Pseudomonadota bacterium]
MRNTLIGRFLLLSILWLVVLLPLWYVLARWFAAPAIWLAGAVMKACFAWVDGWHQEGVTAVLHTLVQVRMKGPQGDVLGELAPEASYPTYGYGLVLLWAMLLASRTERWWLKGLVGSLILIPVQAWGIGFQWLRDVVLLSGPYGAAYLKYSPLAANAVAYGYQFGFLMLPPVTPILLWLAFNKRFVAALWLEAALEATPEQRREAPTKAVD